MSPDSPEYVNANLVENTHGANVDLSYQALYMCGVESGKWYFRDLPPACLW